MQWDYFSRKVGAVSFLLVLLIAYSSPPSEPTQIVETQTVPSGFRDTLVARVSSPIALAFTPMDECSLLSRRTLTYVQK